MRKPPPAIAVTAIVGVEKCENYVREDKSVAVDPLGVLGVESHELVPHDVGDRSHAHGRTRMAGVCLERGIDLYRPRKLAIDSLNTLTALLENCGSGVAGLCMAGQAMNNMDGDVPQGCGWC
jgi:hypothetical protein